MNNTIKFLEKPEFPQYHNAVTETYIQTFELLTFKEANRQGLLH